MKSRGLAFAFAVCLVSSFALADNPSDAPLVTDDSGAVVVQQDNRVAREGRHTNKKHESQSSTARRENASNNNCQTEKGTAEQPVATDQGKESI